MKEHSEVRIMLVDDDTTDRELFVEGLKRTGKAFVLTEAIDGRDALKKLREMPVAPHFIFLDLNMPVKDGRETLRELKADPKLKSIPVIILSTSNSQFDVNKTYEEGAAFFISKPHDFNELVEMQNHWLSLAAKYASFVR